MMLFYRRSYGRDLYRLLRGLRQGPVCRLCAFDVFYCTLKSWSTSREYSSKSREPYLITVAGQCMHVLTAPEDVQSLYKHTGSLSWVRFVQDLYRWIGISPYNINKLWQAPTERQKHSNPIPKLPPNEIIEEYQFRQLLLGEKVDKLTQIFVDYRGKTICWQHLETKPTYVLKKSSGSIRMSLMDWTTQVFLHTTTEVYWSKAIFEIAPRLTQSYLKWEESK